MGTILHWFFFGVSMWWWKFRHNDANDRAVIFVQQGPFVNHELAIRRDITKDGQVFQYAHGKHAVIVKPAERLTYWEDQRMLSVVDGETISTEFNKAKKPAEKKEVTLVRIPVLDITLTHKVDVKPEDAPVIPIPANGQPIEGSGRQQDETLISNVIDGHMATELAESPTAPSKAGWGFEQLRWVLLIVAALIIIFVIYKFVLHGHIPFMSAGNSTATPAPNPTVTPYFSSYIMQIRAVIGV